MRKYRAPLTDNEITELSRLSKLNFSTFSETDVREEFLVELIKLLGYRRELDYSVSREDQFNLHPLLLSVGSSRIKLDYLCSLRKKYFWILEAKNGRCSDITNPPLIDKGDIGQAHFYSLHPEVNCKYFVVSNGWYTNLYHRDTLDENCTPIISIKNSDLESRFLELDDYIGSTQIISYLKKDILEQVERTLSAEVRVERLDEFIKEVKSTVSTIRPHVLEQAKQAYTNSGKELFSQLKTDDISNVVFSVFENTRSRVELKAASQIIIDRLIQNRQDYAFKEYFFFDKLSLRTPKPVSMWYYPSVMYLLLTLQERGFEDLHFGQMKTTDLLNDWVTMCLSHLSNRPVLRYMWIIESLFGRLAKKTVLFFPMLRDNITQLVEKALFYYKEEEIALLGPSKASELIQFIETFSKIHVNRFYNSFYEEGNYDFKEQLAQQEYQRILLVVQRLDQFIASDYDKIKSELGGKWSELVFFDSINVTNDLLGGAVCDLLTSFPEYVKTLPAENREKIKFLAEVGYTNYAKELCKILEIDFIADNPVHEIARKSFFLPWTT